MIIRAGRPALLFGPVAQLGERTVRIRKVVGSNPFRSTKMNDPTQFEQVDETCGLSRVILCLKSLDVTAFLRIDAPWKI